MTAMGMSAARASHTAPAWFQRFSCCDASLRHKGRFFSEADLREASPLTINAKPCGNSKIQNSYKIFGIDSKNLIRILDSVVFWLSLHEKETL